MNDVSSLSPASLTLREGDIYRWSYADEGDDRPWGRYHCKSSIAIVSDGRLRDTYWQVGGRFYSDSFSFGPDELYRFKLTFLGNMNDLERHNEGDAEYFDNSDIVDLNHPNSSKGNFYIRKGAKRSAAKMLQSANDRLDRARRDAESAKRTIGRLLENIARIENGDTSGYL